MCIRLHLVPIIRSMDRGFVQDFCKGNRQYALANFSPSSGDSSGLMRRVMQGVDMWLLAVMTNFSEAGYPA